MISNNIEETNLEKLNLWKKTYSLFSKYSSFEGPFYTEGYHNKKIGVKISRFGSIFLDIDLLAVDDMGNWLGIELTTDPNAKKDEKLDKYDTITPDEIMHTVALKAIDNKELFLFDTNKLETVYPEITFRADDTISLSNIDRINNNSIRNRIAYLDDKKLHISPSLDFTMAPESSPFEVKVALVPIIYQLLSEKIQSITAEEMVDSCLTTIFSDISYSDKKGLVTTTKSSMLDLIQHYLPGYIQIKNERYTRAEKKLVMNSTSFGNINEIISKWVHSKIPQQTFLEGY